MQIERVALRVADPAASARLLRADRGPRGHRAARPPRQRAARAPRRGARPGCSTPRSCTRAAGSWGRRCGASPSTAPRSRAPATISSPRRCTSTTPTRWGSSSTATARATRGPRPARARRCTWTRSRWTSRRWPSEAEGGSEGVRIGHVHLKVARRRCRHALLDGGGGPGADGGVGGPGGVPRGRRLPPPHRREHVDVARCRSRAPGGARARRDRARRDGTQRRARHA